MRNLAACGLQPLLAANQRPQPQRQEQQEQQQQEA
jgi:hypothetical protein